MINIWYIQHKRLLIVNLNCLFQLILELLCPVIPRSNKYKLDPFPICFSFTRPQQCSDCVLLWLLCSVVRTAAVCTLQRTRRTHFFAACASRRIRSCALAAGPLAFARRNTRGRRGRTTRRSAASSKTSCRSSSMEAREARQFVGLQACISQ